MAPWYIILGEIERRLVQTLLRSPTFHRGVQKIHKHVTELRHGKPPEEMGGTAIDDPTRRSPKQFFDLLWEEVKNGHKPGLKDKK